MLNVKNILFAHDFSPGSHQALPYALDLADRTDATLHLLYAEVLHGSPFDPEREPPSQRDKIRTHLRKHAGDLPAHRVVREVVRDVAVAPALLRYAEEHDVDLIVMGTHGRRGVRHILLGSVAEEVVRQAPCPVLTVRKQEASDEVRNIEAVLAPVDFSRHARGALRHAKVLAALYEARLTLLHVVEETLHPAFYGPTTQSIYDTRPDIEERTVERMRKLYQETEGLNGAVRFEARPGRASREIARFAKEEGIGLIVMATHGRTGLEHFTMGSVAEKVVRRASCPVFTVKSFGKSVVGSGDERAASKGKGR